MPTFTERLKEARAASGLSQKELASKIHLTQQAYAKYETGAASPNPDVLSEIAAALNVTTSFLLPCDSSFESTSVHSDYPASLLAAQYDIPTEVFAIIADATSDAAENWIERRSTPSAEQYERIANFFNLDSKRLQMGFIPLFPSKEMRKKVYGLTDSRFPGYRTRGACIPRIFDESGSLEGAMRELEKALSQKGGEPSIVSDEELSKRMDSEIKKFAQQLSPEWRKKMLRELIEL